jgi:hypothetical protein
MHRRDVLKALATLPLATALVGCERERNNEDESRRHSLEVHLDGAFALVIQENKSNSILAFSPRPKKEDEAHQFYFNGYAKSEDLQKSRHFRLSAERRDRDSKPEVSPGLSDFSFRTERWRVGDSPVTIELPAPRRITFSGHRSQVKFLSGQRQVFMPTNHILEYDLKDATLPKLECSDSNMKCEPSPDSFPGVTRFFFEIGPKRSLNPAESRSHAILFFNYLLQQCFPDLAEKYQLDPGYSRGMEHAESIPRAVPAVFQYDLSSPLRQNASYAVDCEFAGPLASTKTLPLNP